MDRNTDPASVAADVRWRVRKKIAAMLRKARIAHCHPWVNGEILDKFVETMDEREAETPGGRPTKAKKAK